MSPHEPYPFPASKWFFPNFIPLSRGLFGFKLRILVWNDQNKKGLSSWRNKWLDNIRQQTEAHGAFLSYTDSSQSLWQGRIHQQLKTDLGFQPGIEFDKDANRVKMASDGPGNSSGKDETTANSLKEGK